MKAGWLAVGTILLIGCGGRMQVDAHPASVAPEPPPPTAALPGSVGATSTAAPGSAGAAARSADTAARNEARIVRDSVADAQALDSLLSKLQLSASLPDLTIDSKATWDLNVASFAEQPRVKYYLDYFTGRAHDRFQVWLQRMGHFEGYARQQFIARKLPGDFVYLALIESGFSPEAVSHAYAVGMWQFMIGTGRLYGLRVDTWIDERRDPIKSTDAAAHHLDDLTQHFGSHYLAAAAYNAGAGRVERGLGHLSATPASEDDSTGAGADGAFFSLADTRMIRDETKNYVPQLIAAAIVAKEPNKYGFDAPSDVTPFSRDSVMVDGGTGLDLMARLADTTLEAMHELNPNLLRMITPPTEPYPVRVPSGSAARVAVAYAALPPAERVAVVPHQVRAGETVVTLSKHYNISADLIRSANRSARSRSLAPGTVLYIPVNTSIPSTMLREPDPPRTTRTVTRTITVRAGESIASVAKRAGVSVASLRSDNGLTAKSVLHAGQKLTTHRTTVVAVATSAPAQKERRSGVRRRRSIRRHRYGRMSSRRVRRSP